VIAATLKGSPYIAIAIAALLAARPFEGRVVGQQTPRATIYEGARLIDGGGGAAIENSVFVVADGRFTQIGRRGGLRAPADAAHVDLTGKTVMPALVDAHAHLGYRKGTAFTADNFTRDNILDQLNRFAYWGVSGVLSTGTDIGDLIFQIRNASNAAGSKGPLVRTAWRGIAPPDAGPFPPMRAAPFAVKTEADARADVRELASRKVDFVKIWVDDRNGTLPKLSPAIYTAIIDEAHKSGLRVIAHVVTLADVKDLLRAGIDGFAHLFRDHEADAEVIALLKARPHVFFMLTLWAPRLAAATDRPSWLDDPALRESASTDQIRQFGEPFSGRTPQSVAAASEEWNTLKKNVAALGKAGVTLVLGTDVGGNTGGPLLGWKHGRGRHDAGGRRRGRDARIGRRAETHRTRHDHRRQARRLHRPRRQSTGGHRELAEDFEGVSAGVGSRSSDAQVRVEQTVVEPRVPSQ
jgi:imidazolonepropionase-like amidohydrolase